MNDLDLLEAEAVGFDLMDLARALPDLLKGTGQALQKKPAEPSQAASSPAVPPGKPAASGIGLGWKLGGAAAAAVGLLLLVLRRR